MLKLFSNLYFKYNQKASIEFSIIYNNFFYDNYNFCNLFFHEIK